MTIRTFLLAPLDPTRGPVAPGASWLAIASGVVVAAPVARFFMAFDDGALIWGPLVALVAFTCTTLGTWAALRAEGWGTAVAWVFVGNVVPPTVLCVPTVIGLFFSFPAGLLAFSLVLPMVLWARALAGRERPDDGERMRLVAALFLGLTAHGVLAADFVAIAESGSGWGSHSRVALALFAPGALLGILATLSALSSFAPDAYRLWLRAQLRLGHVAALEHDGASDSITQVRAIGAGPHRSATTREPIARLGADARRAALGAVFVALGVSAIAGTVLALFAR